MRRFLTTLFFVLLAASAAPMRGDETCMSPFLPKITGQEDYVYVWTLGIDGVGDGSDKLVMSIERANRPHRADRTNDNLIDLADALVIIGDFGEPAVGHFEQLPVDPSGAATVQDLIISTDPVMEGQIVLGRNPIDSSDIVLDPGELQRQEEGLGRRSELDPQAVGLSP